MTLNVNVWNCKYLKQHPRRHETHLTLLDPRINKLCHIMRIVENGIRSPNARKYCRHHDNAHRQGHLLPGTGGGNYRYEQSENLVHAQYHPTTGCFIGAMAFFFWYDWSGKGGLSTSCRRWKHKFLNGKDFNSTTVVRSIILSSARLRPQERHTLRLYPSPQCIPTKVMCTTSAISSHVIGKAQSTSLAL